VVAEVLEVWQGPRDGHLLAVLEIRRVELPALEVFDEQLRQPADVRVRVRHPHHRELEDADDERSGHVVIRPAEIQVDHEPPVAELFEQRLDLDPIPTGDAHEALERRQAEGHLDDQRRFVL
jgi:hypothetical protein